jgi:multiple sugar transport system substrate-binding protein
MPDHSLSGATRRAFLRSSAAFGFSTLALPALAQDFAKVPEGAPAPDGPIRWLDSGGQKGEFHKEYLQKYADANGLKVVYDGLPWQEIATVLPLGIRNGSAPDTFNLPLGMEPSVAVAEGWIQPIDDYIPDLESWKAAYPGGAFVEGINVFDGKTYGFPYSTERRFNNALLFNRDMMAAAGYDQIGPDRALTFDEMRDAAAKIKQNSGGAFGWIIGGGQVNRWGDAVSTLAQRAGLTVGPTGLLQGMNFTTGEYVYGSDEYVAAVELLLAMRDDGSVFPGSISITAPQAREFITQGAAGMIIQGPWNVPIWEANAPNFNFGVSPAPAPEGMGDSLIWVGQLPNAANMMWMNKAAKNPYQMAGYFRWLGSTEGQLTYAPVGSSADPAIFPDAVAQANLSERANAMIKMAETYVRIHPNPLVRNSALTAAAAAYVDPTPNLSQAVQGLFAGQLTGVKETLQAVADARNAALDAAIAEAQAKGASVSRDDFVFPNWNPSDDYGPDAYAAI